MKALVPMLRTLITPSACVLLLHSFLPLPLPLCPCGLLLFPRLCPGSCFCAPALPLLLFPRLLLPLRPQSCYRKPSETDLKTDLMHVDGFWLISSEELKYKHSKRFSAEESRRCAGVELQPGFSETDLSIQALKCCLMFAGNRDRLV